MHGGLTVERQFLEIPTREAIDRALPAEFAKRGKRPGDQPVDRQDRVGQVRDFDIGIDCQVAGMAGAIADRVQARAVENEFDVCLACRRPFRVVLHRHATHGTLDEELALVVAERELVERSAESNRAARNAAAHERTLEPVIELRFHDAPRYVDTCLGKVADAPAHVEIDFGRTTHVIDREIAVTAAVEERRRERDPICQYQRAIGVGTPGNRAGEFVDLYGDVEGSRQLELHIEGRNIDMTALATGTDRRRQTADAGQLALRCNAESIELDVHVETRCLTVEVVDRDVQIADDAVETEVQ